MARGAGRSRVGTVRRAARFFEAQPLGMNTFPPRSASSVTSPRSVKWQRAPAASRDWPRQDVGLVTADLTRRPAARLVNSPTHLITELAATQKRFAAATLSDGSRQVHRLVTMYTSDWGRVGKGCVRTCRSRWPRYHHKKRKNNINDSEKNKYIK